jgi:hypothetical protein
MDINIAMLPDKNTRELLMDYSRLIDERAGSEILLNERDAMPHVTLYMTGFPEECISQIGPLVSAVLADRKAPTIRGGRWVIGKNGTVLFNLKRSAEMDELHRLMIHKLHPLRGRERARIWEKRRDRLSDKEREKLDQTGFPQSLEGWSPHFTVARIAPARIDGIKKLLENVDLVFIPESVGVGYVGPHGTFSELIQSCPFGLQPVVGRQTSDVGKTKSEKTKAENARVMGPNVEKAKTAEPAGDRHPKPKFKPHRKQNLKK